MYNVINKKNGPTYLVTYLTCPAAEGTDNEARRLDERGQDEDSPWTKLMRDIFDLCWIFDKQRIGSDIVLPYDAPGAAVDLTLCFLSGRFCFSLGLN